jgi:hypothetical protein
MSVSRYGLQCSRHAAVTVTLNRGGDHNWFVWAGVNGRAVAQHQRDTNEQQKARFSSDGFISYICRHRSDCFEGLHCCSEHSEAVLPGKTSYMHDGCLSNPSTP